MYLFEKIRSKSFDWNEFVNVTSIGKPFQQRKRALQYAEENGLLKLGEGSSRRVFMLTPKLALKIAMDDDGRSQNKKEDVVYNKTHSPVITKVFKNSDDYTWIVSELVRPVKSDNEFYDLTGININDIRCVLFIATPQSKDVYASSYNASMKLKIKQSHYDLLENDFVKDLIDLVKKTKIAVYDIDRIQQYGVTTDQRVVLLDFGI